MGFVFRELWDRILGCVLLFLVMPLHDAAARAEMKDLVTSTAAVLITDSSAPPQQIGSCIYVLPRPF